MDKEKEMIYIALCNSCNYYITSLEEEIKGTISKDEKDMLEYLIEEHLKLIDKYALIIGKDNIIKRPVWERM